MQFMKSICGLLLGSYLVLAIVIAVVRCGYNSATRVLKNLSSRMKNDDDEFSITLKNGKKVKIDVDKIMDNFSEISEDDKGRYRNQLDKANSFLKKMNSIQENSTVHKYLVSVRRLTPPFHNIYTIENYYNRQYGEYVAVMVAVIVNHQYDPVGCQLTFLDKKTAQKVKDVTAKLTYGIHVRLISAPKEIQGDNNHKYISKAHKKLLKHGLSKCSSYVMINTPSKEFNLSPASIIVCEGVETAQSIKEITQKKYRVLAILGVGNYKYIKFPEDFIAYCDKMNLIPYVLICADNDAKKDNVKVLRSINEFKQSCKSALLSAKFLLEKRGFKVDIIFPKGNGKDYNDMLVESDYDEAKAVSNRINQKLSYQHYPVKFFKPVAKNRDCLNSKSIENISCNML